MKTKWTGAIKNYPDQYPNIIADSDINIYPIASSWLQYIDLTINNRTIWKLTLKLPAEPLFFIETDDRQLEPISEEEVKTHELRNFLLK